MNINDYMSRMPMKRRNLFKGALAATAGTSMGATLLAACGSSTGSSGSSLSEGKFPSHPKWNFVFVNHVTTNTFFTPTQYGIQDACALLGCTSQWTGSQNSVVAEMVNAMQTAITSKADGIAIALIDNNAFNSLTDQALSANIPVVAYNADTTNNSNHRLAYIGQDLYTSGQQLGQKLAASVTSGEVAGFIATPGSGNIQPRMDGAMAAFKQYAPNVKVTQIATGAEAPDELNAIDAYYLGHKSVKGMFAVDGGSTQGLGQIMDKYGLVSKGIHAGGFDLQPKTLQEVQAGNLDFTIDQQPYLQGFLPVVYLFLYKLSGGLMQPPATDTGLLFVTKSSVGPYLNTQTRFEGSTQTEKVVTR